MKAEDEALQSHRADRVSHDTRDSHEPNIPEGPHDSSSHQEPDAPRDPHVRDTADGSHTLFSDVYGQHYHNPNGAIAESRHVFFEPLGLGERILSGTPTRIFEVGFGTGLNLLLLVELAKQRKRQDQPLHFMSVEASLASLRTLGALNHAARLGLEREWEVFLQVRETLSPGWNEITLPSGVRLSLFLGRLEELASPPDAPDAIFHDPFSPVANPECWSIQTFETLREWSAPHTTLRTYGASSHARIAMAAAGWYVAKAPGALGKREMTLASLDPHLLAGEGVIRMDERRLASRAAELG